MSKEPVKQPVAAAKPKPAAASEAAKGIAVQGKTVRTPDGFSISTK